MKKKYLRKNIVKVCLLFTLLIFSVLKLSTVNASEPPSDLERIRVGISAPNFNLESVDGKWIKLSDYLTQKNVILVFYRGWWWPYCVTQLVKLNKIFNENSVSDTVVLAISVDNLEGLKKTANRLSQEIDKSNIELLSDPDHKVIDSYGLLNPESRGLPHPATYIIDKEGVVRWKFVEIDYRIRPDSQQVLKELKSIVQ